MPSARPTIEKTRQIQSVAGNGLLDRRMLLGRGAAIAGAVGSGMDKLREIGLEAERAMLKETSGANTHRGAIFALGLLSAAAGATWSGALEAPLHWNARELSVTVRRRWGVADNSAGA